MNSDTPHWANSQPAAPGPLKPVLFLHIPKTAGTSFATALQNLFGDARVLRLAMEDPGLQAKLDGLSGGATPDFACINGHLPAHIFSDVLDSYEAFTLLRNPVHRVMSLFRFLRRHDAETLAAMGLAPDFSFTDFIQSRDHNLYQQINNGMTRALCGEREATGPHSSLFWNFNDYLPGLDGALALLDHIEFGLAEEMEKTQARLSARWGLPFALPPMRLNTTTPGGEESSARNIRQIVACNTLDIALYEAAALRFHARGAPAAQAQRADTVFRPAAGTKSLLGNIPGRTGFHPFEEIGFAWIEDTGPACLHLRSPMARGRLEFEIYTVVPTYPAEEIVVRLDGRKIAMRVTPGETCWFTLTSDVLALIRHLRPIELSIELPYALPTRFLHPGTPDRRSLGVGVSAVTILP